MTGGISTLLTIALGLVSPGIAASHAASPKLLEQSHLLQGHARYEFTIAQTPAEDGPHLIIRRDGRATIRLAAEGGLDTLKLGLASADRLPPNELHSQWLYSSRKIRGSGGALVFLFGHAFASEPGPLYVVSLPNRGKVRTALAAPNFELNSISVARGRIVLIGRRSLSQIVGKCLTTYDPISVFHAGKDGGSFILYP